MKEIQLLEQQIKRLDEKKFDLEAWKKYTIVILARIFGPLDEKIRQIEKLEFEFTSWSLRDASGNESYEEGTKKLAREILQAAIDELKIFGLPEKKVEEKPDKAIQDFLNILLDEMKGSQVKQLKTILSSRENKAEKHRQIRELLSGIGEYEVYDILASMLMHPEAVKMIKS
ncbi:MAG: hypothetical protein GXO86_15485 [Chlorobi bacterium]|nr:hypothetical protein [Chlorobiota bacterium]